MTERMEAYRSYFDEMTPNGNTRMENIILCAGHRDEHQQHIKRQVTLAFYGGWRLATEHVDALLKAEREAGERDGREKALREAAKNFRELEMFGSATECEALISKDKTDG